MPIVRKKPSIVLRPVIRSIRSSGNSFHGLGTELLHISGRLAFSQAHIYSAGCGLGQFTLILVRSPPLFPTTATPVARLPTARAPRQRHTARVAPVPGAAHCLFRSVNVSLRVLHSEV